MKQCEKCHKENRDRAVFCRHCGTRFAEAAEDPAAEMTYDNSGDNLSCIVGMEAQKAEIRDFVSTIYTPVSYTHLTLPTIGG